MKKLIVNADDFGLTSAVSRGIIEVLGGGIVRSTSAMLCAEETGMYLERWRSKLKGKVGVHLQLTGGVPCSELDAVPSLVKSDGRFPTLPARLGEVCLAEVKREWHAQIERLIDLNFEPTHVDTHHHVHKTPGIFEEYCAVAMHFGLQARSGSERVSNELRKRGVACADYCETRWWGGEITAKAFLRCVESAFAKCGNEGVVELMCHPGYVDDALKEKSSYVAQREAELKVLSTPHLIEDLECVGIQIVDRAELMS